MSHRIPDRGGTSTVGWSAALLAITLPLAFAPAAAQDRHIAEPIDAGSWLAELAIRDDGCWSER